MEKSNYKGWTWIRNDKSIQNGLIITGKYLFFADDKQILIELAEQILHKYELLIAKVPSSDIANNSKGFGFVLCVYDTVNRHCNELKNFQTNDISFRYWKSDATTKAGIYSKQYKSLKQ